MGIEDNINGAGGLQATMCHAATVGREGAMPDCRLELVRTTAIPPPPAGEANEISDTIIIVIGSAAAAVAIIACAIALVLRRRRGLAKESESESQIVTGLPKSGESKDAVSDTASTATPEVATSEVQTDISGDVSEVASLASSREGTEAYGT